MLPKKERLSREAFNRFFSLGKRTQNEYFQVVYAHSPALHVSVVISKKLVKKAVKRNVLRRRVYDIVRRYRSEKRITGVFIFIAKPSSVDAPYDTLKEGVRASIEKAIL